MYTVYVHIFPNGKRYVGLTSQNVEKRWLRGGGYVDQNYVFKAIKKYGWDNIEHVIWCSGLSKAEASDLERELIARDEIERINFGL